MDSIETGILPYVKQMTSPSLMYETVHSKLVHWDNPEGWDGEGRGRGFEMCETCTTVISVNVWQQQHNILK